MKESATSSGYWKAYVVWAIGCFFGFIVIPILLDSTSAGGEARGLTFASQMVGYALYSVMGLSAFFLTRHQHWTPTYLWSNALLLGASGLLVFSSWYSYSTSPPNYSFKSHLAVVGADTVRIEEEYYTMDPDTLRSRTVFRRHPIDTTRIVYNRQGHILSTTKSK